MEETDTREDQLREYQAEWERLTEEGNAAAHSIAFVSVICECADDSRVLAEYRDAYRRLYGEAEAAWSRYYALARELRDWA